ncbi:hypothetical protein QFZ33_000315 [Arthrobacter globiformis]|nr:hypothetical protein [Arthrobacter globiformis]
MMHATPYAWTGFHQSPWGRCTSGLQARIYGIRQALRAQRSRSALPPSERSKNLNIPEL